MKPLFSLLLVLATILLHPGVNAYSCTNFFVNVTVTAPSYELLFPPFSNHFDSVQLLLNTTARAGAPEAPLVGSATNITSEFSIGASYCVPETGFNGAIQVLAHGLGFDRSYWQFAGPDSEYNYVKAATEAGYATFLYDRIGTGISTFTDPYSIVQGGVEVAVLTALTEKLRNGTLNGAVEKPSGKVLHVGHSYGSAVTNGLIALTPELSDGVVLTGYSTNATWMPNIHSNFGYPLARENRPRQWGNLSSGYLTWNTELSNQYAFFHYPDFSPEILRLDEETKQPYTAGEVLIAGPPYTGIESKAFAGPIMIFTGHYDQIFCGGNCDGVLEQAAASFPSAKVFKTQQVPDTGHAINLHYSAPEAYRVAQKFFKDWAMR